MPEATTAPPRGAGDRRLRPDRRLRSAALTERDGSIDRLCFPRFDSPACFAALLGTSENGRWLIAPAGEISVRRWYCPETLVLETEFTTPSGVASVRFRKVCCDEHRSSNHGRAPP